MRNYIRILLASAFVLLPHAITNQKLSQKWDREERCPSLFVAVLSTAAGGQRRSKIRKMWQEAGDGYGQVMARFTLCIGGTVTDEISDALRIEQDEHNDLLLMEDCAEGYLHGALTKKVESAMKAYLSNYSQYSLFMKVDDDTFVSTRRFCDLMTWRRDNHKDNMAAYFGVFAEGPTEAILGEHFPIRDPDSPWYEPVDKFSGAVYPVSAKGGPGYAFSQRLVRPIIEQGIAGGNELNNEDKAVGVWVDKLIAQGIQVDIVNVPGTDGYDEHKDNYAKTGPYQKYKAALHHHLTGERIACLHEVDHAADPERTIDHCFGEVPDRGDF